MYGQLPEIETKDGQKIHAYPVVIHNPPKTAALRLPTNGELEKYMAAQIHMYTPLGRGKGKTEALATPAADLELFNSIRLDKGLEFDDAEALYALTILTRHKVTACVQEGNQFRIVIMTLFGTVSHVIELPFQRDIMDYDRNSYTAIDLRGGKEERRFPPHVTVSLYNKYIRQVSGYEDKQDVDTMDAAYKPLEFAAQLKLVPSNHKRTVILELTNGLAALDPDFAPNS
jgi:hypothetical protein